MIVHRKTADAHHRRCRQFRSCPGCFDSFLRQVRPWSRTTGVNSEPNGLPISDGRETVAARHRRELAKFLASSPRRSPRRRGLSPPSRGAVTTITEVLVLPGLTKDPVPPTPPPSKMRGWSPALGALSYDPYRFSGAIGFDERSIAAHAAPPRNCRDCPRNRER
jgi:hypothetical protein